MKDNKSKIYLIVIAIVVALALVWLLVLRDSDSDNGGSSQPDTVQSQDGETTDENQQPDEAESSDEQEAQQPQTELEQEAVAILAVFQDILTTQQQYSASCPTEEVVIDVSTRFNQANLLVLALTNDIIDLGTEDGAFTFSEPLLGYQQQIDEIIQQLSVLGPEIIERCNLGHLVQDPSSIEIVQ